MKRLLPAIVTSFWVITGATAADNMKAFPPADKGMVRHVLALPPQENETDVKVELQVGKTIPVDPENRYFFGGKLENRIAQGWGFTYYVLTKLGPMGGTRIAIDPNAPKVERFVATGGEPVLLRYNSKLPLVVYVPEGVEVRYRLWRGSADYAAMPAG